MPQEKWSHSKLNWVLCWAHFIRDPQQPTIKWAPLIFWLCCSFCRLHTVLVHCNDDDVFVLLKGPLAIVIEIVPGQGRAESVPERYGTPYRLLQWWRNDVRYLRFTVPPPKILHFLHWDKGIKNELYSRISQKIPSELLAQSGLGIVDWLVCVLATVA